MVVQLIVMALQDWIGPRRLTPFLFPDLYNYQPPWENTGLLLDECVICMASITADDIAARRYMGEKKALLCSAIC